MQVMVFPLPVARLTCDSGRAGPWKQKVKPPEPLEIKDAGRTEPKGVTPVRSAFTVES